MLINKMFPLRPLFIAAFLVLVSFKELNGAVYTASGGPIYVNPNGGQLAQQLIQPTEQQAGNYVTQTVYGFLDFTTTIGNTVMVFSPQSVPPDPKPSVAAAPQIQVNTVIETKANVPSSISQQIKPSKTVTPNTEKKKEAPIQSSAKKLSSIVQVKSEPKVVSSIVHVQNVPHSAVNIIEGTQNVVTPKKVITTKVEVVPPKLSSKVATKVNVSPPVVSSHVEVVEGPAASVTKPLDAAKFFTSIVDISTDEPIGVLGNNIGEPEYDFLSRQPSEFIEETFRVVNLKPSLTKFHLKPRSSTTLLPKNSDNAGAHPTGLVTKMGGTVVKDGATTVHETSVIGTYISGKYAQVLQSTSHIYQNKVKPTPTATGPRILKTAAPTLNKAPKYNTILDPTPANTLHDETLNLPLEALFSSAQSSNLVRPSRRPALSGPGNFKNRFKGRSNHFDTREQEIEDIDEDQDLAPPSNQNHFKKQNKNRPAGGNRQNFKNSKFGRSSSNHHESIPTVSVFSEQHITPTAAGKRHYQTSSRRNSFRQPTPSSSVVNDQNNGYTRRGYKPRLQSSNVEPISASTSVYKFKLNRSPGRWQYKTTPKPRVTIRKQVDDDLDNVTVPSLSTPTGSGDANQNIESHITSQARSDDLDLEPSGSSDGIGNINDDENTTDNKIDHQPLPVLETIKVEISTPADFKDIYYEIATIKSPYTFQVGSVKNTRYITVTSTIEKTFMDATEAPTIQSNGDLNTNNIRPTEPLTENILATTSHYDDKEHNLLDSSIATLPPLQLAYDMQTPPLETLTETFSTTQDMLKTHILPVVHGINDTTSITLVQTYHVTRLVTATKTLPPMEVYQFVPSKTLKEFNSRLDEAGSELHLELEFGDDNENDEDGDGPKRIKFPSDLDLANIGNDFNFADLSKFPEAHLRLKKAHLTTPKPETTTPALSPEQLQQLALLRFLNPNAQLPQQVITTSKPVVKLETVYESHVIPIFNGVSTSLSTLSRPVATVSKTEYEYGTSTLALPQIPQLPTLPPNPLLQPQLILTSTPVVTQTMVTNTDSKVLKLTFGAKTAYTTLFSTRVVPTVLTTYITTQVPVQPTAAGFPGFFPAPYAPYPFVG